MIYGWMADAVLLVHLAFIVLVLLGGLLTLRWPRVAFVHLPSAVWGILVEVAGWTCPLTPLEVAPRQRAGQAGFTGGFIEHYVTAVVYPEGLTRPAQIALGILALLVNVVIYGHLLKRRTTR
jgi:hypothetical protein